VSRTAWIVAGILLAVVVTAVVAIDLGTSDDPSAPQAEPAEPVQRQIRPALSGPRVVRGSGPRAEPMPVPAGLGPTVGRVERELRGVPQSGFVLGDPNAPISITEYGDPRCLECALIHRDVIPEVVRRYVATGRASFSFRPWPLYGPRSEALGRAALSASRQGRYWDYLQVAFLRSIRRDRAEPPDRWASALGLDLARWRLDLGRRRWQTEMEATVSVAEAVHLPVMPVFLVRRTKGGAVTILAEPRSYDDFLLAIAQTEDLRGPA
jgi:Thioredoxin